MPRTLSLCVLLTCILLLVGGAALFEVQRIALEEGRAHERDLVSLSAQVASLRTALGALAVGQRANGEADARLYADVRALEQALAANARRDRARFGLTVSAIGAR